MATVDDKPEINALNHYALTHFYHFQLSEQTMTEPCFELNERQFVWSFQFKQINWRQNWKNTYSKESMNHQVIHHSYYDSYR